jgi:hypothetical protein
VFLWKHLQETLISLRELRFGGYFQINYGRAALESFSVTDFMNTLSVYPRRERENHRKIASVWYVTGPSRCMLTSSQYTGTQTPKPGHLFKYATGCSYGSLFIMLLCIIIGRYVFRPYVFHHQAET